MKIRNSKSTNLIYATLAFLVIFILVFKSYSEYTTDNSLLSITIGFGFFFGAISVYFIRKAYDKRPLYEIDQKTITVRKSNASYLLKDLYYYRHERLSSRYGALDHIYFYNEARNLIFKISLSGTDHSAEQVIKVLKNKLEKF